MTTTRATSRVAPAPTPSPRDVRRLRGTLVVAGAGLLFGVLAALVRLGWGPLVSVDDAVATGLNAMVAPHPALIRVLTVVTSLGGAGVLVWLVVLTAILLLTRRRFLLAGYLAVATSAALILDPVLKALIGRIRPVVAHPIAVGGGNSFPSGHALDSFICYGALVLVFLPAFARRRRWIPITVAAVIVVAVGLSRIMLGVHFVSDVVGAWSAGVAWLGLTVYAFELYRRQEGRRIPQPLTEGIEPEARGDVEPAEPAAAGAPAGPGGGRVSAWLVIGWVFVLGVVVGLGELIVHGSGWAGGNLLGDESIPRWLAAHRTASLDAASDVWSQAGNTHAIMAVGLVAGAVAVGLTRRWRPAVFLVVLMMGELGLFLASAKIIGRDRPDVGHLDGPLPTSAYPSGHVAATLCLYTGIALLVLPRTRAWWRWLFLVPAVAMPILVAVSRMYRGMHHPTDVLASLLLAAGWTAAAYLAIRPDSEPGARAMTGRADLERGRMGQHPLGRREDGAERVTALAGSPGVAAAAPRGPARIDGGAGTGAGRAGPGPAGRVD